MEPVLFPELSTESSKEKGKKFRRPIAFFFPSDRAIREVEAILNPQNKVFIPGNVPSMKNSKQIAYNPKTSRYFIVSSPATKKYKDNSGPYYLRQRAVFLAAKQGKPFPLRVSFKFIRRTKQDFDYINILQIVQDYMVQYKWLPDDNINYLLPVFEPVVYDEFTYGVVISVL